MSVYYLSVYFVLGFYLFINLSNFFWCNGFFILRCERDFRLSFIKICLLIRLFWNILVYCFMWRFVRYFVIFIIERFLRFCEKIENFEGELEMIDGVVICLVYIFLVV